jgi:multiple sugar transport system permease protein
MVANNQPTVGLGEAGPRSGGSAFSRVSRRLWKDRWIYLFLFPTLLLYGMYTVWPIVASWYYSLLDWNGFERSGRFVGLANFYELARDPLFWNAFRNTFIFLAISVPLRVGFALVLAVVLNDRRLPFANLFRTALFLPVVTTGAIVGVVMRLVLDPVSGPVNLILMDLELITRPINFLGRASSALYSAIGVWVWKWLGITLIYWLAALQTIPGELYEAARIDGAGPFRLFRHITLPMLTPFTVIIVLITAVEATNVFDLLLTLTGGGPFFSSEVIDIYIYRWAFTSTIPRLGYASAAAIFFGISVLLLTAAQVVGVRRARRRTKPL